MAWWAVAGTLLNSFTGSNEPEQTTVTVTEQPAPGSQTTKIFIIAIVAIAILTVVYLMATGKLKL